MMLFPGLQGNRFGQVDLDALARRWFAAQGVRATDPNPLLDPGVCAAMIAAEHRRLGLDHSYGGWLEDRRALWRGTYLDQAGTYLHLGVDVTVPVGTEVALDRPGTVWDVDSDVPEEGGWGTRVIIQLDQASECVVYAHLDPDVRCEPGQRLAAGTIFAKVGAPPANGGWFPHLHVQRVQGLHFGRLAKDGLRDLDGYGLPAEREALAKLFPDPLEMARPR